MDEKIRQALREGEKLGAQYALQVPQMAPMSALGLRLGRRTGTSIDFQDYREYQPGDDIRFIDWNVYARTDRMAVKLFREEVTPHLDLLIDGSRSMNLEGTAKAQAAAYLAAALAIAAANAHCSHAVWLSADGFRRLTNGTQAPATWDGLEFNSTRTIDDAFELLAPRLRRLSMRVLISDLLWPANPIQTVRRLQSGGAALFIIQLLARDDAEPPAYGSMRLVDSETGETSDVFVDAAVARQYSHNLAQWQQAWADACRQCGAQLTTVLAEELDSSLPRLQAVQLLNPA